MALKLINKDMEKYYSFYLGPQTSTFKDWALDDCKIRAIDIKEALILHFIHCQYVEAYQLKWFSNKYLYEIPDKNYFFLNYRRIIEYIKVQNPKHGRTISQFKKNCIYSQYQIITFFR